MLFAVEAHVRNGFLGKLIPFSYWPKHLFLYPLPVPSPARYLFVFPVQRDVLGGTDFVNSPSIRTQFTGEQVVYDLTRCQLVRQSSTIKMTTHSCYSLYFFYHRSFFPVDNLPNRCRRTLGCLRMGFFEETINNVCTE